MTIAQEDGTQRSFRRKGDVPKVDVKDPLQAHRGLRRGLYRQEHARRDRVLASLTMTSKILKNQRDTSRAALAVLAIAQAARARQGRAPRGTGCRSPDRGRPVWATTPAGVSAR